MVIGIDIENIALFYQACRDNTVQEVPGGVLDMLINKEVPCYAGLSAKFVLADKFDAPLEELCWSVAQRIAFGKTGKCLLVGVEVEEDRYILFEPLGRKRIGKDKIYTAID
jgi:hypothetical protein